MARGQPEGEAIYRPEVNPEDLPRKIVPEYRQPPVVAEAFGRAGTEITSALYGKYQADSATYAGNQLSDFRLKATQALDQMKSEVPSDQAPDGFTQKYLDKYDEMSGKLQDAAQGNPLAQRMIAKGVQEMRTTLGQHVVGWEAEQTTAFRQNSVVKNAESQAALVEAHPELAASVGSTLMDQVNASGGDPRVRLALGRHVDAQLTQAASNGLARQDPRGTIDALNNPDKAGSEFEPLSRLSDAEREGIRAKANSHLSDPVFSALSQNDTRSAKAYLDRNRDVMDPKVAWELDRRIDAQVKEKENEARQGIADKLQDNMAAASAGLPITNPMTRAEFNVLYPKDGDRRFVGYQTVVAASAQAHEYDRMTPEAIAADVQKAKPTEGGAGVAFALEGYGIRARAAQQSLAQRQKDPAQFAVNNGSWQPIDMGDPQAAMRNLTTRANTQAQVSEQLGVNAPLLSKPETKAVTSWLDAQPPQQRLTALTQLRQSMPSDVAYAALLKQIAPGSPLTALAGSTVDRPNGEVAPSWWDSKYAPSPTVGQRILEGEAILKPRQTEKGEMKMPSFPMPADAILRPAFQAAVGGANSDLFRGRDQTLAATYAAFKAAYAAEASASGRTNGIVDSGLALKAAQDVVGNVTTYGHTNVVVPPGMDPTRFEGAVDFATQHALSVAGYSKEDAAALRSYGLRELGDTLGTGRYVIINGHGDALRSKDGKEPVIVDLNRQFQHGVKIPTEGEMKWYERLGQGEGDAAL